MTIEVGAIVHAYYSRECVGPAVVVSGPRASGTWCLRWLDAANARWCASHGGYRAHRGWHVLEYVITPLREDQTTDEMAAVAMRLLLNPDDLLLADPNN